MGNKIGDYFTSEIHIAVYINSFVEQNIRDYDGLGSKPITNFHAELFPDSSSIVPDLKLFKLSVASQTLTQG